MHLQRVRVPDFRVLQDVDIEFEKEFFPNVFPLGSQNGGGKSTLLQLIFVLLHCSQDPERIVFLENLLEGFQIPEGSSTRDLASFEIWDGEKTVLLEFFCCNDSYLAELVESSSSEENGLVKTDDMADMSFSAINEIEEVKNNISEQELIIQRLNQNIAELQDLENNQLAGSNKKRSYYRIAKDYLSSKKGYNINRNISLSEQKYALKELLDSHENSLKNEEIRYKKLKIAVGEVYVSVASNDMIYVCNYSPEPDKSKEYALLCHAKGSVETDEPEEVFLEILKDKIFLAAPANQVFLFIDREATKQLFLTGAHKDTYKRQVDEANSKLPGLLAHDFMAVDLLIEAFKAARDRDFIEMSETGKYGSDYPTFLKEFKSIGFYNIIVNVKPDLSGVTFKINKDGEEVELYPEDLSHGELKMLSIYTWLKHRKIENAIVLMDEIEMAFHPDWQYQIIRDLQDWAPSNQYILATHSYDICEAVTPPHVKELEPKLLKSGAEE